MELRQLIPRWLVSRMSFETKYAISRAINDIPSSFRFLVSGSLRRRARQDLERCHTTQDYFECARRWLGVGPVQILDEISEALDYVRRHPHQTVCEIGTEHGGTSLLLAHGLPDLRRLICVDLFVMNMPRLRMLCSQRVVRFVNGASTATRSLHTVRRLLGDRELDVLFIDGDHRYEGVRRDFLEYSKFVREGGLILFHDIVPDHRTRFGIPTAGWSGGVPIFWKEIKQVYQHQEFVRDQNQNGLGIGILKFTKSVQLIPPLTKANG